MSSLRFVDLDTVARLVDFIRGAGYVLDFSDRSFSAFFATELNVDIYHVAYAENGSSKGRRLWRFLELVDNATAEKALRALWAHRCEYLLATGTADPVAHAQVYYVALINRLGGGPTAGAVQEPPKVMSDPRIDALRMRLSELHGLEPRPRGFAFEGFLNALFDVHGLRPREAFRNRGEQIDGSFVLAGETYLLEAKWEKLQTGVGDLRSFEGKVEDKAAWTRGLFVSFSGFTADGLVAFGRSRRTICVSGDDIDELLGKRIPFDHVVQEKARRAAESGRPFVPISELF